MKILFDTNVVLDLFLDRKPFVLSAAKLFSKVEESEIVGVLGATSVTTIYYLVAKTIGNQKAQSAIHALLKLFEIASVNRLVLENALSCGEVDFEDAVLLSAAIESEVIAIVTRDEQAFKGTKISIYSPEDLLVILESKAIRQETVE